jgi:hypothetical protein
LPYKICLHAGFGDHDVVGDGGFDIVEKSAAMIWKITIIRWFKKDEKPS